ncbi:hypothetical protein QLQ12_04360 [Actinoplanes sp. NEAU-A12]|uniref:Uncharacterized protein n=1 Tax=Actinoplanes sandaracinus TaxID=3045177 RepID=A0ABT6WDP1_9ACTN|nr:hypothetical protein [Actinoplanes sandaracinus]MDI6097831.1 hypothetical protein [Actinoplanes sandaracinus]
MPEDAHADPIARMPAKDPDDRVYMIAAVAAHVAAIVNWNLADFSA